jgi:hypothetical protein
LIRSYYFGSRGAQEPTLNKHPVFNALFNALESSGITKGMYSRGDILSPPEMEVALKTYKTNFSNMWKAGTISNKLLNHLLDVLLRVHLAPKREAKRTEYIEEISQKNPNHPSTVGLKPLSRNDIHNIIRAESHNIKKCERKAAIDSKWQDKLKACQDKINYCRSLKPVIIFFF